MAPTRSMRTTTTATAAVSVSVFLVAALLAVVAEAKGRKTWKPAHATFYGPPEGTMGGACGYGDESRGALGVYTAAQSTVLFQSGSSCGSCYELRCDPTRTEDRWCIKGASVTVTVTDLCPPDYSKPNDNGGWCNPPLQHFDMAVPAYKTIGVYQAGIIPVLYRRVPCPRYGGVRFTMKGNPYFNLVLITNVGGPGALTQVWIKGQGDTNFRQMTRNWGENWQAPGSVYGQSVSFVLVASNGKTRMLNNVVPSFWSFDQTYEAPSTHQV